MPELRRASRYAGWRLLSSTSQRCVDVNDSNLTLAKIADWHSCYRLVVNHYERISRPRVVFCASMASIGVIGGLARDRRRREAWPSAQNGR